MNKEKTPNKRVDVVDLIFSYTRWWWIFSYLMICERLRLRDLCQLKSSSPSIFFAGSSSPTDTLKCIPHIDFRYNLVVVHLLTRVLWVHTLSLTTQGTEPIADEDDELELNFSIIIIRIDIFNFIIITAGGGGEPQKDEMFGLKNIVFMKMTRDCVVSNPLFLKKKRE